jgi:hypothetical protein
MHEMNTKGDACYDFNLEGTLRTTMTLISLHYKVSTMLLSENGIVRLIFRSKDKMFIYGESEAREELKEDRMKTMKILLSCYDRVQKETSVKM